MNEGTARFAYTLWPDSEQTAETTQQMYSGYPSSRPDETAARTRLQGDPGVAGPLAARCLTPRPLPYALHVLRAPTDTVLANGTPAVFTRTKGTLAVFTLTKGTLAIFTLTKGTPAI